MWNRVFVDTIAMPKASVHPTDSRLLERIRQHPLKVVQEHEMVPHQSYDQTAKTGRYGNAKLFKRTQREVARQLDALPAQAQAEVCDLLARAGRILTQRTKDKNKLCALHAPEVECIIWGARPAPPLNRE